jgi:hypothetical protein
VKLNKNFFKRWAMSSKTLDSGYNECYKKSRYRTKDIAEMYKQKAEAARPVALRVYSCNVCSGYHITKKGEQ